MADFLHLHEEPISSARIAKRTLLLDTRFFFCFSFALVMEDNQSSDGGLLENPLVRPR